MNKIEMENYLNACKLCLEFLNKGTTTHTKWIDENGDSFSADIGYMEEGLEEMQKYLEKNIGE